MMLIVLLYCRHTNFVFNNTPLHAFCIAHYTNSSNTQVVIGRASTSTSHYSIMQLVGEVLYTESGEEITSLNKEVKHTTNIESGLTTFTATC